MKNDSILLNAGGVPRQEFVHDHAGNGKRDIVNYDEINDKQVAQANEASAKYQIEKTQRDKNNEVQYVEVEKIVRQPIYLSDCIDADGLREINRAAASK